MRPLAAYLAGALLCFGVIASAAASPVDAVAGATARYERIARDLSASEGADRMNALIVAVSGYEGVLSDLRAAVLEARRAGREGALDLLARRDEVTRLLAALQSAGRMSEPARSMHPQGPLGAARARMMIARLEPAMRARAAELAGELAIAAGSEKLQERGEAGIAAGLAALAAVKIELSDMLLATSIQPDGAGDQELAQLVRESDTLNVLAEKLIDVQDGSEPAVPGGLIPPVRGGIARGYEEPDAAGVRRPGIVVQAAPLSPVVAPLDATVRYAGPFLDYGYVVVLESAREGAMVLAGLAQLRVASGEGVQAGGFLGLMGGRTRGVKEYLMMNDAGTGSGIAETLYIEVRNGHGPVDPAGLFAGENG